MSLNSFLLTDTNGRKSSTVTVFIIGAIVVNLKLILSGMTVMGVTLAPFTGGEYSAAMGALGAIYVLRRSTDPEKKSQPKDQSNG